MKLSRTALFDKLGVRPTNRQWSWCAMDEAQSRAVFTVWKDEIHDNKSTLTYTAPDITRRPGFKDQERVIDLVIHNNLPAFGLVCEAVDTAAETRSIKDIDAAFVSRLRIERIDGIAVAHHEGRLHFADVIQTAPDSALGDLAFASPAGNLVPDRALKFGSAFKRDRKVRAFVLQQARGRCEFCKKIPFQMPNGQPYLEAHHILSLAGQGPDTVDNVIALCADCHREAHFGKDAEELEKRFLECMKERYRVPYPAATR